MLSPVILVPAVLNGLMTGAVYALVALGLTLIYGVLHIINFAHGALLTAAMFAAFFAYQLARARSLSRRHRPDARCFSCSATRCSASSSARPRTARTATSCWSRSASPSSSRTRCSTPFAPTRAPSTCPTPSTSSSSARPSSPCRASSPSPSSSPSRSRCGSSCAAPTPARRSARSPRRSSAPSCPASTSRTSMPSPSASAPPALRSRPAC